MVDVRSLLLDLVARHEQDNLPAELLGEIGRQAPLLAAAENVRDRIRADHLGLGLASGGIVRRAARGLWNVRFERLDRVETSSETTVRAVIRLGPRTQLEYRFCSDQEAALLHIGVAYSWGAPEPLLCMRAVREGRARFVANEEGLAELDSRAAAGLGPTALLHILVAYFPGETATCPPLRVAPRNRHVSHLESARPSRRAECHGEEWEMHDRLTEAIERQRDPTWWRQLWWRKRCAWPRRARASRRRGRAAASGS